VAAGALFHLICRKGDIMTNVLIGRRRVCFAALVGLVAIGGLLAAPGDADAMTKAARAKAKTVRAPKALKKQEIKRKVPISGLRFIGIQGVDTGGNGCSVRAVSGWAQAAGVDPGDVITQVENRPVSNTTEADAAVGDAIAAGQTDVVLFVTDVNTGTPNVPILVSLR
jgi:S1-C subfamily serine protease